jgi:hypothetical protein
VRTIFPNFSLTFSDKSVVVSGFLACGLPLREDLRSVIQRHVEAYVSGAFFATGSDQKRR